jgi:signal transduction histidine kinase
MTFDELTSSLGFLAKVFEGRNLALAVTDDQLRVLYLYDPERLTDSQSVPGDSPFLSDIAPELIGYESALDELMTGRVDKLEIEMFSREVDAGATRYLRMLLRSRPAVALSPAIRGGDGGRSSSAPQPDAAQERGVIMLLEDITPIGEMQQRLMQSSNELLLLTGALDRKNRELAAANQELRKLDDVKTTFVSMTAHELRTPLAVMRGYADMLLDEALGDLNDAQCESLRTIRRAADRLLEVVNNLLDLTRLEAGRMELLMHPLDLGALVQAAAREFRPLFAAGNQRFRVRAPAGMPAVLADETKVFQILSNLLSNAAKYTPPGGVVDLAVDYASAAGELQVSVRDNGVGIPADEQDRLGSLFFRARTANQVDARGVGLGLYITNSLVQLHGGRLWFESQEGRGSTFFVTFLQAGDPDQ